MNKRESLALLIVSIFLIGSVVGFTGSSFLPETIPDIPNLPEQKELSNITHEPEETKSVPTGWTLGESVKTDVEFSPQIYDYYYVLEHDNYYGDGYFSSIYIEPYAWYSNDAQLSEALIYYSTSTTKEKHYLRMRIFAQGAGVLNTEYFFSVYNGLTQFTSETDSAGISITSDMLDSQGYLHVYFEINPTSSGSSMSMFYLDVDADIYTLIDFTSAANAFTVDRFRILFDVFSFTRTTIENNIRSSYQYASESVITHSVTIPSVQFAKEINIYAPEHWSYSSINPSATVTSSGSDYTIASPTELEYTIMFTSNSNYFLVIEETTNNYYLNTGFENGECFLLHDYGNFPSSAEIKTDNSFEGSHSFYASETGTYWLTFPEVLPSGNYYFSLWYYIETFGDGFFGLYWKDFDNGWNSEHVFDLNSATNRWQRFTFYFEQYGGTDEIMFKLSFGTETSFYIDSLSFFEVSTEISTTDLDEYSIESTFISWDGYQNPTLSNEDISFELWDRTSQTKISTYEAITNDIGIANWIYDSSLEQKEYLINVYTYNNRFGDYATMDLDDTWDFDEGDYEGWSEKGSVTDKSITDNCYKYTTPATGGAGSWSGAYSIDSSEYSHIFFRMKVNESYDLQVHDYPNVIDTKTVNTSDFVVYTTYAFLDSDWSGTLTGGIYLRDSESAVAHENYLDLVLVVGEAFLCSFYFTPSFSYQLDYAEEELSDRWDFSEGDNEGTGISTGDGVAENGYLLWDSSDVSVYMRLHFDGHYFDFANQYYTAVIIRFLVNETDTDMRLRMKTEAGNDVTSDFDISSTDTWYVQEFDISNWDDADAELAVNLRFTNAGLDIQMKIDYVRLVHAEEEETYFTNTYLGIGSDNDAWESAVYSDNVYLGNYADPYLVALNQSSYGTHNISWIPFNRAGEVKAFLYDNMHTFTYDVSEPANYYTLLNPPSFDIASNLVYIDLCTAYQNTTYRLKMNTTWLGAEVNEGSSVWTCDFTSTGFYNFTLEVYQNSVLWDSLTTSITIAENEYVELELQVLTKDVDTSVSQIFVNYYTNWGNTSVKVFDNTTQLGSELFGEGASIWSFSAVEYYAFHNISVCIYHDSVLQFTYYFSFTIQESSTEIYTVHFDIITPAGIGLNFETAKIYVNNSRIYASEQYYLSGAVLDIIVTDFYNHQLTNRTVTITENRDIFLIVDLYYQHIENPYAVAVSVLLTSTVDANYNHTYIITAHTAISVLLFTNSYNIRVTPLSETFSNETHLITYFATTSNYQDLGYEPTTYTITMDSELDALFEPEPPKLTDAGKAILGISIFSLLINAVAISFFGAFGKLGLVTGWNWILYYPNKLINAICSVWGGNGVRLLVDNKGGMEFINPIAYEKQNEEKKRLEGRL